jgi:hypothetical protein
LTAGPGSCAIRTYLFDALAPDHVAQITVDS